MFTNDEIIQLKNFITKQFKISDHMIESGHCNPWSTPSHLWKFIRFCKILTTIQRYKERENWAKMVLQKELREVQEILEINDLPENLRNKIILTLIY